MHINVQSEERHTKSNPVTIKDNNNNKKKPDDTDALGRRSL